jgi:predicted ATPase/DNA-binding SARP family transcriptional activator
MLREPWTVQLLGELRAAQGPQVITRFYTRKIGGLFAYLAYHPQRAHPREGLIDLFWPDAEPEAGRTSLRTALASLRRQLEPPAVPAGTVLIADRSSVRLNAESIRTDVAEFEREIRAAGSATHPAERIAILERALALYRGELLPGRYEEWIPAERERLSETCCQALRRLSLLLEEQGDGEQAIDYARRAVQLNPLEEAAHFDLIRQYAGAGQLSAATRQYHELERALREAFDEAPSWSLQELMKSQRRPATMGRTAGRRPPTAGEGGKEARPRPEHGGEGTPRSRVRAAHSPVEPLPPPLPVPLTPFFGREAEIRQVSLLLEAPETRLVTLTGLGGTGKTRLAIEVARRAREGGHLTVYFVPLADIRDVLLIGEAMRTGMGLPASGTGDPIEQIVTALADQPALLVLDNFEQLLPGGPDTVRRLLERLPRLTCLATSRLSLGLTAEWEFPVAPLPTPAAPATPEHLLEFPSVRLFTSRAQAVRPDFQVTPANAQVVAQLCHSLEGIPLALELAAARAQVLTPAQMLTQLARRFDLLSSRRRDMEERHRTLRAAMDWSYELLSPGGVPQASPLQGFFARLSVFRGGWTLGAAAEVCGEGIELPTAVEYLEQLREHSLVVAEDQGPSAAREGGEMRYRMLETVREYSEEKLAASGEADRWRRRHVAFFIRLAREAEPHLRGAGQAAWLDRLEAEHDNFRAALESCAERSDLEAGLGLAGALWKLWDVRGHVVEGRERLTHLLSRPDAARRTSERAKALYAAGYLAWCQSDYAAAQACMQESLAIRRELGERQGVAETLGSLGAMALFLKEHVMARALLEESRALWQALEVPLGLAETLARLGELERALGNTAAARALQEESLAIRREAGARWDIGYCLWSLGNIACDERDFAKARKLHLEALRTVREVGDKSNLPYLLEPLAAVAAAEEEAERAVCLFGASAALRERFGVPLLPGPAAEIERQLAGLRAALGAARFGAGWEAGRAMSVEQAVAYALQSG